MPTPHIDGSYSTGYTVFFDDHQQGYDMKRYDVRTPPGGEMNKKCSWSSGSKWWIKVWMG